MKSKKLQSSSQNSSLIGLKNSLPDHNKLKNSMRKVMIVTFGLYALAGFVVHAQNLILDGSFETPVVSPGGHAGLTSVGPWNVTKGTVALYSGSARGIINPAQGNQQIDLDSSSDALIGTTINQAFITIPNRVYEVSFNVGWTGNPSQNPGVKLTAEVFSSDGTKLASLDATPPQLQTAYGPIQKFTFTATTSETTLSFRDTSSTSFQVGVLLDNVSVISVGDSPKIVQGLADQQVPIGGKAVFSVGVGAGDPATYQWFYNGVALTGETNNELVLEGVRVRDAGEYSVKISNQFGSVQAAARLLVSEFLVEIFTAVELKFPSSVGKKYQIQALANVNDTSWSSVGEPIDGTGQDIFKLISARETTAKFFRAVELSN
ncbi:MAG: DUF642 domain-containing protein [Verrucomicrobia bacterium]|nr:DUF642 domain-containing protein [Verrucomicrobiota bacterium]